MQGNTNKNSLKRKRNGDENDSSVANSGESTSRPAKQSKNESENKIESSQNRKTIEILQKEIDSLKERLQLLEQNRQNSSPQINVTRPNQSPVPPVIVRPILQPTTIHNLTNQPTVRLPFNHPIPSIRFQPPQFPFPISHHTFVHQIPGLTIRRLDDYHDIDSGINHSSLYPDTESESDDDEEGEYDEEARETFLYLQHLLRCRGARIL